MILKTNCESSLEQLCNVINGNKTFSIYLHVHVDIDALGSGLALKRILENMGKVAHVFVDSTFPNNAMIFEDINKVNNEKLKEYDVCIMLDANDEDRLGRLKYKYRKNTKTSIKIDHHMESPLNCRYNYIDTSASSTCELVYRLIKKLNVKPDTEACRLLISGIYTDTGCLKFSNVQPSTFQTVSELQTISGFKMDEITFPLFNSLTMEAFDLRKLAYNRVELYDNNTFAIIWFTPEDFKTLNVRLDETKGIVDIAMQIDTVKIVAMISESPQEYGTQYLSIRSKGEYSAKRIAETFGGGGHIMASGCKIMEDLNSAKEKTIQAIREEINRCKDL